MKITPIQLGHMLILTFVWLLGIWIVGVEGDFPLNDDWAYGKNVYELTQNGQFRLNDWPAMTFLAQMLWGSGAVLLFGFSFTVLRISILVIGAIGLAAFYLLCLEVTKQSYLAFGMCLLLLVNPYFFSLSFTFMTDVPFLCCSVISMLFFSKTFRDEPRFRKNMLLGMIFLVIATMIRQLGLLLGLYFLLGHLIRKGCNFKSILVGVFPLLLAIGVLVAYVKCLKHIGELPVAFTKYGNIGDLFDNISNGHLIRNLKARPGILLYYLGWFFLPFVILNAKSILSRALKNLSGLGFLLAGLSIALVYQKAWFLVPKGGLIDYLKIGPMTMKGAEAFDPSQVPESLSFFLLKLGGLIGGILLIFLLLEKVFDWIKDRKNLYKTPGNIIQVCAWFLAGCYFVFLMLEPFFFDRYYLFFFPFVAVAILPVAELKAPKVLWGISLVIISLYLWFSFAGTHDFLERNRARWKALGQLTQERNISPNRIDGGFEFNGWNGTYVQRPMYGPGQPSWWFVDRDDYVVTLNPIQNFEIEEIIPYKQYISYGRDSIYVLKRPRPNQIDTITADLETFALAENKIYSNKPDITFSGTQSLIDTFSRSAKHCIVVDGKNPFALSHTFRKVSPGDRFMAKVWLYGSSRRHCLLVFSGLDTKSYYQRGNYTTIKEASGWGLVEFEVIIPDDFAEEQLKFYVWNSKSEKVYADDLEIIWMKY